MALDGSLDFHHGQLGKTFSSAIFMAALFLRGCGVRKPTLPRLSRAFSSCILVGNHQTCALDKCLCLYENSETEYPIS
jgi:hypothetical protein